MAGLASADSSCADGRCARSCSVAGGRFLLRFRVRHRRPCVTSGDHARRSEFNRVGSSAAARFAHRSRLTVAPPLYALSASPLLDGRGFLGWTFRQLDVYVLSFSIAPDLYHDLLARLEIADRLDQ